VPAGPASQVHSYEKNADVIWLRSLNPWSPETGGSLTLTHGDIAAQIGALPAIPRRHPARPAALRHRRRIYSQPSTTNWRESSSATANYSTTPAHRTN